MVASSYLRASWTVDRRGDGGSRCTAGRDARRVAGPREGMLGSGRQLGLRTAAAQVRSG